MRKYVESEPQREKRRLRDRLRAAKKRAAMTPEQRKQAYAANGEYQRRRWMELSLDERRRLRREMWLKYHGDSYRKRAAKYQREKRRHDKRFAIAERLRARVKTAVKRAGASKSADTEELVGCKADFLVSWLEAQFEKEMSWANRSEWHIDHIIPCCAFNLCDDAQQRIAFHYTNLRPVWRHENQRKSGKIPLQQTKFLWTLDDIKKARVRLGACGAKKAMSQSVGSMA
jgi:hypothetical protein